MVTPSLCCQVWRGMGSACGKTVLPPLALSLLLTRPASNLKPRGVGWRATTGKHPPVKDARMKLTPTQIAHFDREALRGIRGAPQWMLDLDLLIRAYAEHTSTAAPASFYAQGDSRFLSSPSTLRLTHQQV